MTHGAPEEAVLLLGGTGRTGGRVLQQLLDREVPVRALVRSAARLPEGVASHPLLDVIEADVVSLSPGEFVRHLEGCATVISCLGHNTDMRSIFGPPFDVVTGTVSSVVRAAQQMRPDRPVRFILMSSVSVNRPDHGDSRRGAGERFVLTVLRALVPPARDNQRAADFLARANGSDGDCVEWVIVRPDTLLDGDVTEYRTSDALVGSLFKPDETNMANVAHFMCELACDDCVWQRWRGAMPVIVNAAAL